MYLHIIKNVENSLVKAGNNTNRKLTSQFIVPNLIKKYTYIFNFYIFSYLILYSMEKIDKDKMAYLFKFLLIIAKKYYII